MKRLKKILNCKKGSRCNSPLSCKFCGTNWQRGNFKAFCTNLDKLNFSDKDSITYFVIKPKFYDTLNNNLELIYSIIKRLQEYKKRGKLPILYSRIEVSFKWGFMPHLNIICFNNCDIINKLQHDFNITIWKRKKSYSEQIAKSIAWYMLKFNNIGIEKGEAVRRAINKRKTLFVSREFKPYNDDIYIDELIDIDFGFLGVMPIRSQEEIELRKKVKKMRQEINLYFKKELAKIKAH